MAEQSKQISEGSSDEEEKRKGKEGSETSVKHMWSGAGAQQ